MESSRCLDPSSPWEPWALSELFPGSRPAVTPWLLLAVFPWPFARRSAFAFNTLGPTLTFWPSQLAPKELIAIMILIDSKFIQTAPKHWLFSHKIYSCDCNYLYIIFWLIPLSQLAGPLQTTVSKNPKKSQQRPPAAVAATAASAWRVKMDENGRLYVGNPQYWDACSLSYFEYSLSCFEYNIYIYFFLFNYLFIFI